MTENGTTVLREALALPVNERAQVAADLIASLDEEHEEAVGVASAWAVEIERRAGQVLRDPSSGEDWDATRDRVAGRMVHDRSRNSAISRSIVASSTAKSARSVAPQMVTVMRI